ncbi:MAG: hypothetical protein FD189_2592, partial [Elusimicrobia bacterium]
GAEGGPIKGLTEGSDGDAGGEPGNGPQGRRLGRRGGEDAWDDDPSLESDQADMSERVADDP